VRRSGPVPVLGALAAASAALSASTAVAAPAAGGPGKPTVTLNFLDVQTNGSPTIPQNQRPKLGDRFWFHNNTYKWNGAKRGALVGHTDGTAVVLTGNIGELSAVAYYPGGTLDALGQINFNSPINTFAVAGGTGIYATARGEVTVRSLGGPNSNMSAITVRLWM
jgi:hypothetical protein